MMKIQKRREALTQSEEKVFEDYLNEVEIDREDGDDDDDGDDPTVMQKLKDFVVSVCKSRVNKVMGIC